MSLLGTIFSKIFPSSHAANRQSAGTTQPQANQQASSQTQAGAATSARPAAAQQAAVTPMQTVDVEQVLNDLASKNSQKLNWRTSIVDLMKLVGMDSSLDARK